MDFTNKPPKWENTGTEPTTEEKQSGWVVNDKVPAQYLNWFWNKVSKCLEELQNKLSNENTARGQVETELQNTLTEHIDDKKEPHIQRISLDGTSFEDIINGTYTGLDGDDYITEGDVKRFYLTNIGWGNDCVELIVSGNRIDSGCIQVLNVYRAYNEICKQYYRIKSGMPWTDWKLVEGVETIDGGYADTWRTAEAFNSAYELENVKRYKVLIEGYIVGDLFTIAYTDAVTNFVTVDQWLTFMHTTFYRQGSSHKNTLPKLGWKEWKQLNVIDNELSVTSTNAVQNKVVTAEIDNIKANINALPKTGAESGTIATCIKENKTETVAIDANNPYYVYPEEGYGQYVIEFENTPTVTYPVIVSYTKGGSSFLYKDSPFYVSDTKVVIPIPFEGDDVSSIKISDKTANTVTVTATSSIFAEVKDGSIGAAKLDTELAERISNIETDLANALDGLITYGTEELTDGVSELPTGTLYIVYE